MQRSFDDLGTPLCDVTFVVLDLETTGGSPANDQITEVGALKFHGGECLGTFQTLVNPGVAIPPSIVYLTGITEAMVRPAPTIDAVLPAFLEFLADSVIVGHNVRFDMGFLQANLQRHGYRRLGNTVVDTCGLARRLVRDEVANCTLATLARHFRTAADPCHRALDDAKATAEVFHLLLERAGTLGVLALDDLVALPKTAAHPQVSKLRWVSTLPRKPGVYVFRDGSGNAIYVGKAKDLRHRVRSYFAGDSRRKIGPLLREAQSLDHVVCAHELEASVLEVRMILALRPRFNRKDKNPDRAAYVKLTNERFPRLSVVRTARGDDGCTYVGPVASGFTARLVAEAIESAIPLRRCAARPSTSVRDGPCAPAQLGVATCPCSGAIDEEGYRVHASNARRAMVVEPRLVLDPLGRRMHRLADAGRFEEAATVRDRARAFALAVERQRKLEALRATARIVIDLPGGGAVIEHGELSAAWGADQAPTLPLPKPAPARGPVPKDSLGELLCVAGWLDRNAHRVVVQWCDGEFAWPADRVPRFDPLASNQERKRGDAAA